MCEHEDCPHISTDKNKLQPHYRQIQQIYYQNVPSNCGWTDKMCVDTMLGLRRHAEVAHRICVCRMTPGGCLRNDQKFQFSPKHYHGKCGFRVYQKWCHSWFVWSVCGHWGYLVKTADTIDLDAYSCIIQSESYHTLKSKKNKKLIRHFSPMFLIM